MTEACGESEPKGTKIIIIDPFKVEPTARKLRSFDDGTPVSHPEMPNLRVNPNDFMVGDIIAFPPPDELSESIVFIVEETPPNGEFPEDPRVRRLFVVEVEKIRQSKENEGKPFLNVAIVFEKTA